MGPGRPGDLIRAQDWNGLIAAIEAQMDALSTALGSRIDEVAASVADLGARTTALEGQVGPLERLADALRARLRRIDLEASRSTFALGQRGEIVARVTDIEGRPLDFGRAAERPWVDFVTVWGSLKVAPGFTSRGGASDRTVSVQVNADGEALAEEQEQEVEAVLESAVGQQTGAEMILAAPTPDSAEIRTAFETVTRAYERTDTRIMQTYIDTYHLRQRRYVTGPLRTLNWRDHHATVMAFLKPDDTPATADGAQAVGSIRVTFRDWVYPWVVVDYAPPPRRVIDDYRDRFRGMVRDGYAEAIRNIHDLMEDRTAQMGLIGKYRHYAGAREAIVGLDIDDPPDYLDDLVETTAGGFGLQQGLLFGQATAPLPLAGAEAGRTIGTAAAQGQKAAERTATETRAETRRQIEAAETRFGESIAAQSQSIGVTLAETRQLAESATVQLQEVSSQLQSKAGIDVVRQLLTVRGG